MELHNQTKTVNVILYHALGQLDMIVTFDFSAPGTSTSSEIPLEEQKEMGLSDGLIRFSIGLDNDIRRTYKTMKNCMGELKILGK